MEEIMGLLDDVFPTRGTAKLTNLTSFAAQNPEVVAAAARLLTNRSTSFGGGSGLSGLMAAFERGGLSEIVSSWISTGRNKPVAAGQLMATLGSDALDQFARQAGLPQAQAASVLATVLPLLVDHVTPDGKVPAHAGPGGLEDLLGSFLGGR
jgi:uncharacterized protein YidB (DUF937 family)